MPLKVLHLISSPYGIGGAEKLLLDMSGFYDRENFSIYYCNLFGSPHRKDIFSELLTENGLPKFEVPGYRLQNIPSIIARLRSLIKSEKIDIVQTHLIHASLIGGIVGKLSGDHKTIITQHYTEKCLDKVFQKTIDRTALKMADRIIAVSSAVKADLLEKGVKENKIRVIHNGIDIEDFDRKAEIKNCLFSDLKKQGKYIIGAVGNLHKRKDYSNLIRAMAEVVKRFPDTHLVIIGEGTERPILEKLIEKNDLENNITLVGFQANVSALIKHFDLYVHPAKSEPFGIAILEAMATSKCVIASKVEGVVDIIENGINGFLVPPQDPQAMAKLICKAIENPKQTAEIGQKARKRVEDSFGIENTVKGYQDLYQEIIRSK